MRSKPIVPRPCDIARQTAPIAPPLDTWSQELLLAQAEATAVVLERVARALERIGTSLADIEAAPPVATVAPGQLRLVVSG